MMRALLRAMSKTPPDGIIVHAMSLSHAGNRQVGKRHVDGSEKFIAHWVDYHFVVA